MLSALLRFPALAAGLLALSACSEGNIATAFNQEAGAFLDRGDLGNATLNNTQTQNGEKPYLIELNRRFNEEVPAVVTFAFDSAHLDTAAQRVLQRQAHWMHQFPEARFKVFGHTDLVGTNAYNKRLGQRRANAVVAYLGRLGISRSRLDAVISFGENRPAIYTESRERRNRRAVTEVDGFVERHPMVLNGKYAAIIFREYVESATEAPPAGTSPLAPMSSGGAI